MAAEVDAVTPDPVQPASADVVIVGGGIIGVAAALFLAERGVSTVLCEKGVIAGEQSSRNWGWCRTMGRDPRELPLAMESLRLWRGMNERVGAETGFRQCGTLYICPDEAAYAKREAWMPHAMEHGVDSRLLKGDAVNRLLEGSAQRWVGALYTPGDGVAEPSLAVPAMARAAQKLGATVLTGCAVRGLDLAGRRVAGVVTERGRIACERVVLAGGVWSSLFCGSLGLRLPQLKVLASVLRTAPTDAGPSTAAWGPGLSLRKRLDGGYTVSSGGIIADVVPDSFRYLADFLPMLRAEWSGISLKFGQAFVDEWRQGRSWRLDRPSPFERARILDPAPTESELRRARTNLERAFPIFSRVAMAASWGGMIDATPDLVPVISEVDTMPGLIVSTGYSGHGFGIGPGAGRLTAELAVGANPVVDPAPFRFSRFTDGSRPRPLAGF
jgi:glycine/D-amino acid oxidase-like deaminating enzyme